MPSKRKRNCSRYASIEFIKTVPICANRSAKTPQLTEKVTLLAPFVLSSALIIVARK